MEVGQEKWVVVKVCRTHHIQEVARLVHDKLLKLVITGVIAAF